MKSGSSIWKALLDEWRDRSDNCERSEQCLLGNRTLHLRRGVANEQFVGENAQAIDGGCFHAQDDGAERDRLATVTAREG